jgi:glycosyltransferase involved in cell wall biosynthesis
MIKVTALTSGRNHPSSRFRVRQFIRPLESYGINVREYYPVVDKFATKRVPLLGALIRLPGIRASRTTAVAWLERELVPERFTLERYAGTRRLLDIDDAIWLNKSRFSEHIAASCHGVIAGNDFIAAHYRDHGARVWTIPTSIDSEKWRPARSKRDSKWTIGWTGSSSNLKYLYLIEKSLAGFLRGRPGAQLLIVCDERPDFKSIPAGRWIFARWSPENEVRLLQRMDVGLMPLADTEWSRGKCALKMLMYMAVGIPSVVSPVGVGKQLVEQNEVGIAAETESEWYDSLNHLHREQDVASRMGVQGRKLVEDQFSVKENVLKLAEVFRTIASE